jgi:hypothetical protein
MAGNKTYWQFHRPEELKCGANIRLRQSNQNAAAKSRNR